MKIVKTLAALLVLAMALNLRAADEATPPPAASATPAAPTYTLTAACFADSLGQGKPNWILILNGLAYRNVDSLRIGIEKLLKGSTLRWEASDVRIGGELLTTTEEMASLKKMCEENGIRLSVMEAG